MTTGGLNAGVETFQDSIEEKFKISELKETFQIHVTNEELQKYGETLLNLKEIQEIQEGNRTVAQLGLEKLRLGIDNTKGAIESFNKKYSLEEKKEQLDGGLEKIGDELNNAYKKAGDTENGKKVKKAFTDASHKTKENLKKIKEGGYTAQLGLAFNDAFEKLKKFDIFGALASFFKGLFGMFVGGEALKKAGEMVKEKLSPEDIEKTKKRLQKELEPIMLKVNEHFPKHPLINQNIQKTINNPDIFSPDIITEIKQKLDSGEEINFQTIRFLLSKEGKLEDFNETVFNEETKEALKQQAEAKIVNVIQKEYNLRINSEKRAELVQLLDETKKEISYIDLLQSFIDGEEKDGFDFLGASIGTGIGLFWFSIKLVSKGIIGAGDLALNVKDSGVKTVQLSLGKLGVSSIAYQDFEKQLEGMSESEKGLLLGVLYRKTGVFAKLLGNITSFTSRTLLELVTPTGVNSIKTMKDSITGNTKNQIDNFQKLAKSLGGSESEVLKDAYNQMNKLIKNAEITQIINAGEKIAGDEVIKAKKIKQDLLNKNLINLTDNIPTGSISELRTAVSGNVGKIIFTRKAGDGLRAFYPGLIDSVEGFYKNLGVISEYQKSSIKGGVGFIEKGGRALQKHASIIEEMKLSRNVDKLNFEGLSKEKILSKTQALRKFAHDMPDLFKHTFGGIAEIAFIGLSFSTMEEGDSYTETLLNDILYMSGLLGPLLLVLNAGAKYDKESKEVQWLHVTQAGVGGIFLAMDTVAAVKILGTNSLPEAGKKIGKNIIARPITASYNSIASLVKGSKNVYDIAKGTGKMPWSHVGKKSIEMLKKGSKNRGVLALTLVAIGTYAAINYLQVDLSEEFEELVDNGIIDEQGNILDENKAKEFFNKTLNDREKEAFIELIINQNGYANVGGNLDIDIDGNILNITILEEGIGEWIVEPEQIEYFKELGLTVDFTQKIPA